MKKSETSHKKSENPYTPSKTVCNFQIKSNNFRNHNLKQEGPKALDHSRESWHMKRCVGLWLKRYHLKIHFVFLVLALVAIVFSQAEHSDHFW